MKILTIRTDKPESELGIFDDGTQVAYLKWPAHRELAETIHIRIKTLLDEHELSLEGLNGIGVYGGPGSFTGLRIGIAVANALADSLQIPIVSTSGDNWRDESCKRLAQNENENIVQPEYGALPHTTQQKK